MPYPATAEQTKELVHLSFFVNIGKAIVKSKTIEETLHEIMVQIGQVFTPLNWSLLLKNAETGNLSFTMVIGRNADKLKGLQLPRGEGIAGWIAKTGQSLIIEDVKMMSGSAPGLTGLPDLRPSPLSGCR